MSTDTQPASEPATKALDADLRRWESIARRRLKTGQSPAYEFESDSIPTDVKTAVLDSLKSATTDEEVKAAFAAGFCWEGYP